MAVQYPFFLPTQQPLWFVPGGSSSFGQPATTTTLGTVKVSAAPVSAGSPIALEQSDPRFLQVTCATVNGVHAGAAATLTFQLKDLNGNNVAEEYRFPMVLLAGGSGTLAYSAGASGDVLVTGLTSPGQMVAAVVLDATGKAIIDITNDTIEDRVFGFGPGPGAGPVAGGVSFLSGGAADPSWT